MGRGPLAWLRSGKCSHWEVSEETGLRSSVGVEEGGGSLETGEDEKGDLCGSQATVTERCRARQREAGTVLILPADERG